MAPQSNVRMWDHPVTPMAPMILESELVQYVSRHAQIGNVADRSGRVILQRREARLSAGVVQSVGIAETGRVFLPSIPSADQA